MNHPDSFVHLKNKNLSRDFIKSRAKKTNDENEILLNDKLTNESMISGTFSNRLFNEQSRPGSRMTNTNSLNRPMSGKSATGRPMSGFARPMSVKSVLRPINTSPNRPTSAMTQSVKFDFDETTQINEYQHQFKNVDKKINKINNWVANQETLITSQFY